MYKVGELETKKLMRKRFSKANVDDDIKKVIKIFLNTDANVIAVFDGRKFVGEIHELDLLKLAVDPKEIPKEEIVVLGFGMDMGYFAKTARDILRRHDVSISPDTKIKDASFIMLKENVKSLPVMKKDKLLGILTERDILKKVIDRGKKK